MTDRGSSEGSAKQAGVLGYLETKVGDEVSNFYDPRFEGRRLFSEVDRKSTRLNSSHMVQSRMPSSA